MSTATKNAPVAAPVKTIRDQVLESTPVKVTIGDSSLWAIAREFSSGSVGFNANGQIALLVDGRPVTATVSLNIVINGTKPKK